MDIELLYFDGCPSWQTALENLRTVLALEGLDWSVNLVKVENDSQASRLKFLGSPSIRFQGMDLWPEQREEYSMSCRLYHTPDGIQGWPTVSMLREAIGLLKEKGSD